MSRTFVTQSISSTLLCLFAGVILATSLVSSNRSATGMHQRMSTQGIRFGEEVLPNSAFYPVLMIRDRMRLWSADENEEPLLRLQYAQRRYIAAQQLAAEGELDIAVSTLSKSQIYALDAARQLEARGLTDTERLELVEMLRHSLYRMELFHQQYPAFDTDLFRSLRDSTELQINILQQK